jgi:OOP family OmpA-OmpF porin
VNRAAMRFVLALILCTHTGLCPAATPRLPDILTLPPGLVPTGEVSEETFGEADFPRPDHTAHTQRGHHWQAVLGQSGVPDDTAGKALWLRAKPALLKGSWTVAAEFDENPYSVVLRLQGAGDAWAALQFFGPDDIKLELIAASAATLRLTMPAPKKTPEPVVAASGDFPYLPPLPGSHLDSGKLVVGPMQLQLPGSDEVQLVGLSSISKSYSVPASISNVEMAAAYKDGLTRAGWSIVQLSQGLSQSDVTLTAHYVLNDRELWALLHYTPGELLIQVADAGSTDLAQALKKDCRIALYGVMFEFNKATLRSESESLLGRAATALKANPVLPIEVQGHTDNVGADAYNLKLSDARAGTVMQWLMAHGVPATQLSAKGYGKAVPVADNATETGRAKNRRVELACRK